MKNHMPLVAMLGLFLLVFSACQKDNIPATPGALPVGATFEATYRIPLTTGREAIGEKVMIDPELAKSQNIDVLKPAIPKIVEMAVNGDIPSYPVDSIPNVKPGNQKAPKMAAKMRDTGAEFELTDLHACVEVVYKGTVQKGKTKMEAIALNLVWVDPGATLPDMNFAQVMLKDLPGIKVKTAKGEQSLKDYLSAGNYSQYIIRAEWGDYRTGVKNYEESQEFNERIRKGIVKKIVRESLPQ